jgi:hypothetical protein
MLHAYLGIPVMRSKILTTIVDTEYNVIYNVPRKVYTERTACIVYGGVLKYR